MVAGVSPNKKLNQTLLNILAWVIMLAMLFPAVWVVLTSFRQYSEINASPVVWIPRDVTLDAYVNMFGGNPEIWSRLIPTSTIFSVSPIILLSRIKSINAFFFFQVLATPNRIVVPCKLYLRLISSVTLG